MATCDKLLQKARNNRKGLRFTELEKLAQCFGFYLARQGGTSHRVYKAEGRITFFVLEPDKNGKARPYQVKQVLDEIDAIIQERGES